MIDKLLYRFVTVSTRSLAALGGLIVVLLLGVFALVALGGRRPTPVVAATLPATTVAAASASIALPTMGGPTATPFAADGPGLGGTILLGDWKISLARMELRPCVQYKGADGSGFSDKKRHYLLWVDAQNNTSSPRSLRDSITWAVRTEQDHVYYSRPDTDPENALDGAWVEADGREHLSVEVPVGGLTHPLLAFRTFDYKPLALIVSTIEAVPQTSTFDLVDMVGAAVESNPTGCQ